MLSHNFVWYLYSVFCSGIFLYVGARPLILFDDVGRARVLLLINILPSEFLKLQFLSGDETIVNSNVSSGYLA